MRFSRPEAFLLAVSVVAQALTPSQNNQHACSLLQSILGQTIVQTAESSGTEYQAGRDHAWSFFNTLYQPTCIVFPESTQDVRVAMRIIFICEADYAVQAGGHSGMTGWNNIQNGILILFSNMKNISYNPETDTITLQPGLSWGEALDALESQGVAPIGGRVSSVGTGLLLGGGLSFLAPAHGFSADAFVSLDVVLVNGEMVTATVDNEYSDLFRALKGGANRFGIVTRYEVSAIHTGTKNDKTWFGGTIYYPASSAESVLRALAHYVRNVKDPNAAILSYFANIPMSGTLTLIPAVTLFYNGTTLPDDVFGELLSIPSTSLAPPPGPVSYYDAANALVDTDISEGQLFGASALQTDEQSYIDAFTHWMNFSQTFQHEFATTILAFTPVLDNQILAGRERGGNPMNPPLGGYNAIQFEVTFPANVTEVSSELEEGRQLFFEQVPPAPGIPLYINECDKKQNVFETYVEYESLKATYGKYDPTRFNVRHTKGPIGL